MNRINFTLIQLSALHLSMSPMFAGSYRSVVISSTFSKSFSPIFYLTFSNSMTDISTKFDRFLNCPLSVQSGNRDIPYLTSEFECKTYTTDDILRDQSNSIIYVKGCTFSKCTAGFINADGGLVIESSVFSDNAFQAQTAAGIIHKGEYLRIFDCNFTKCVFKQLINSNCKEFMMKYCELKDFTFVSTDTALIEFVFDGVWLDAYKTSFCNFIGIVSCIFSGRLIDVSYSYFENVDRVKMESDTPKGDIYPARISNCSAKGGVPKGATGLFNTINPTTVYLSSLEKACIPIPTIKVVWPTQTPPDSAAPTPPPSPTESFSPSISSSPEPTVKGTPIETKSPEATSVPSASLSPTNTPTRSKAPTQSPFATESPRATRTPKATTNVPLILEIVIPLIVALILIPIILYKCIRKIQDMLSDDDYDMGVRLQFSTDGEDSETTSDRSNPLALDTESFSESDTDRYANNFFAQPRRRNNAIIDDVDGSGSLSNSSSL